MTHENKELAREWLVFPKSHVSLHDVSQAFHAAGINITGATTKPRMLTVVATPHDIQAAAGNKVRYEPNLNQTVG